MNKESTRSVFQSSDQQAPENGEGPRASNRTTASGRIRSFVLRASRLTAAQERAMQQLWPRYGLAYENQPVDVQTRFEKPAPLVVEIGFGNGESLAQMAAAAPEQNFLGIEVHPPGVGALLIRAEEAQLNNLLIAQHDAVEVLENMLPDNSIDRLQLYFPDPWHKKKHHKRRIVQTEFAALVKRKLKPGGIWHLATDWQNYAEHMLEVMDAADGYENQNGLGCYAERPQWRPETKFERRGQRLGHGVWDLLYKRVA